MNLYAFDDLYVRRLKEHDRETEAHFHQYFRSLLFGKLRKRLSDTYAIDDITQETFRRVFARLEGLRDGHSLGAFVLGVCNHVVQEWHRSEPRAESLDEAHENVAGAADIEVEYLGQEVAARVRRVLGRLPHRDAAILREMFLQEEEREEICRKHGVDAQYLRVLLHRAKEHFKAEYRRKSNPRFLPETFKVDSTLFL